MHSEGIRIGQTESIFRNVNERIAETAERFDSDSADFVCECDERSCTNRVGAPLHTYERVRANATRFLLAPGHENERVERIVERHTRYSVVEKIEANAAATVRRLNPRAATSG
jgi:hypothetical protein